MLSLAYSKYNVDKDAIEIKSHTCSSHALGYFTRGLAITRFLPFGALNPPDKFTSKRFQETSELGEYSNEQNKLLHAMQGCLKPIRPNNRIRRIYGAII